MSENNNTMGNDFEIIAQTSRKNESIGEKTPKASEKSEVKKEAAAEKTPESERNTDQDKTIVTAPIKKRVPKDEKKTIVTSSVSQRRAAPAPRKKTGAGDSAAAAKKAIQREKSKAEAASFTEPEKKGKTGDLFPRLISTFVYLGIVVAVSVILAIVIINTANDVFALVKEDYSVEITIDDDTTIGEVASILHDNKVINNPTVFKLYAEFKNKDLTLSSGTYTVSSSLSYDQIIGLLRKRNTRSIVTLTFPEGYTVDQTIDALVEAGCGSRENYVEAINNYEYDYDFVKELDRYLAGLSPEERAKRKYRLEGYLFPDTYQFYTDSPESYIIGKFLENFSLRVEAENYERCTELNMTMDQVLAIASIIQKEAGGGDDYYLVSSVIHNRLKNSGTYPFLNCDATTFYGLSEVPETVTPEMHKDETNPYSTYTNQGLPPSAICNVGMASIYAALYPTNTNYYFFASDKNGIFHYSKTNEEHNRVIASISN